MIWVLAIDDSPGRYDEFARLLDRERSDLALVVACHPEVVEALLATGKVRAILLDRDMPYQNGEVWAEYIANHPNPTIITSCTGHPTARETMLATLRSGGVRAIACYADHQGCEIEWLWWIRGVTGVR